MPYTVIPFAKCRPIYKQKDLIDPYSDNVGQYQGIKQEGGDYHHATAVSVKSTVTPHPAVRPLSSPMGRQERLRVLGCLSLHYLMARKGKLRAGKKHWHPVLFILTHIGSLSWMPQTCLKLLLVFCAGLVRKWFWQEVNSPEIVWHMHHNRGSVLIKDFKPYNDPCQISLQQICKLAVWDTAYTNVDIQAISMPMMPMMPISVDLLMQSNERDLCSYSQSQSRIGQLQFCHARGICKGNEIMDNLATSLLLRTDGSKHQHLLGIWFNIHCHAWQMCVSTSSVRHY